MLSKTWIVSLIDVNLISYNFPNLKTYLNLKKTTKYHLKNNFLYFQYDSSMIHTNYVIY